MKTFLIAFLIGFIFLFIGCSEDPIFNIVSCSPNTNELIYSIDSVGVQSNDSGWIYLMSTYTNIPIDYTGQMVVEFEGNTNLDDLAMKELYFSVKKSNSNYYSQSLQTTNEILGFHSYRFNVTRKSELNFICSIIFSNRTNANVYFKDIKVFASSK
ncbi:hypothetical protein [Flavobacterium filum]|uniref:hypothetical protein n=1 Tax=Flavobacterium filum TaxID=370974 RepID=UPI0023F5905D|nr:hypothetical protein [Flavobacterium filum]